MLLSPKYFRKQGSISDTFISASESSPNIHNYDLCFYDLEDYVLSCYSSNRKQIPPPLPYSGYC